MAYSQGIHGTSYSKGPSPSSEDIKPEPGEPRNRLPLYPDIGSRHNFMEMIDAPNSARRYRVTNRSVLVISSGPHGYPARATGVHARRTAILPEAVGRRQRGSAVPAAKSYEAEFELPEATEYNQRVAASGATSDQASPDSPYGTWFVTHVLGTTCCPCLRA